MIDISVSFIKSIYNEEKTIKLIDKSIASYIHVDIMDGIFVKEKNYDFTTITYFLDGIKKPLDIHLMVNDVMKYVKEYVNLKPKFITFHIESVDNPYEIINFLKNNKIGVGIAINPDTSIDKIKPFLNVIDLVLVMGVYPGAGGQKFIEDVIPKINELRELKKDNHYIISCDGGINDEIIKQIDVDMAVSGSFVCESSDYNKQIIKLKK